MPLGGLTDIVRPGHVEVQSPPAVRNLASGHRPRNHAAQQVQASMHAHQAVAPLPIDLGDELGSGLGQHRARRGNMDHLVGQRTLDRVDDCDRRTRREAQQAGVARLPPAYRIKDRAVEPDAAPLGGHHPAIAGSQVGVLPEDELGHVSWRPPIFAVPAEAGTHPAVVTSAWSLTRYVRVEIDPMRIVLFDELNFPSPFPTLDPFFTLHRCFQCVVTLEPDQSINAVLCSKPRDRVDLVLPHPPDKI